MDVLHGFYAALSQRDWAAMGSCYHADARFSDPIFPDLDARQVKAMWRMLLENGHDLQVEYRVMEELADSGRARLHARYTYGASGNKVHNAILSTFRLKEGSIVEQHDVFDLWRWSRQALGWKGLLLGWSPWLQSRVRATAAKRLAKALRTGA